LRRFQLAGSGAFRFCITKKHKKSRKDAQEAQESKLIALYAVLCFCASLCSFCGLVLRVVEYGTIKGGSDPMTEARMQELPEYKPGSFCWVELGTTNADAVKTFYKELFGWDYQDGPGGPDMIYTMIKLNGKDVGGLYQMPSDMLAHGIPPHWLSYVSVASADGATAQAQAAGATVMKEPFNVFDAGRMSVLQDPTGAVFAVWQAITHPGAGVYRDLGAFCWNELGTNDTQKAADFYTTLFGWGTEQFAGPYDYTIFKNGDQGVAGMYKITPEMGPIPPNWLVYFAVADCDATAQKATEHGGTVIVSAEDIPEVGRFAILQDPASAVFAIIKPVTPEA
jgi:predicted enzyme related to lactoylglutathione lyase